MTKFNVLPTNPDFQKLTVNQVDFILESLRQQARDAELASKGMEISTDEYDEDFDNSTETIADWDDERSENYAKQVAELFKNQPEVLERVTDRYKFFSDEEQQKEYAQAAENERKDIIEQQRERLQTMTNNKAFVKKDGYEPEQVDVL